MPYIAGLFVGATVCALDPSMSFEDSKYLIKQVRPRVIFVVPEDEDMYSRFLSDAPMKTELVVFGNSGPNSFGKFMEGSDAENDFVPVKAQSVFDTAVIIFSSGTTGLAKGICLNHFALASQANSMTYVQTFYLIWMACD